MILTLKIILTGEGVSKESLKALQNRNIKVESYAQKDIQEISIEDLRSAGLIITALPQSNGSSYIKPYIKLIKKHDLPLLFIHDSIDKSLIDKLKKAGAIGYITKDFLQSELFPVYVEFLTSYRERLINRKSKKNYGKDKSGLLLEEIKSSRNIITQNAKELILLSSKLENYRAESAEIIQSKDKFFSIIAHDMKGPLQGLIGYTEILSKESSELNKEEIKEIADNLHGSAKLLMDMLEDFLHWAKVQQGKIKTDISTQNLSKIIDMNINLLKLHADIKRIKLINEVNKDIHVMADLNMLNTIVRNLISNAIKFTNQHGNISISAQLYEEEDKVEISFKDDGVGMDAERLSQLFSIDGQHSTDGTADEKGTGLGLILCKELIEKNKGSIKVASKIGEGSNFIVKLPIAKD